MSSLGWWLWLLALLLTPNALPTWVSSLSAVQLSVPALGVETPVTRFYLDGVSWHIDPWETRAGHLQGTAWLDGVGNIVIVAHAEYPDGSPGIFNQLHTLQIGDEIQLGNRRYRVSQQQSVPFDDLTVLYPTTTDRLTLLTCDETSYNPTTRVYNERVVIVAERIQ